MSHNNKPTRRRSNNLPNSRVRGADKATYTEIQIEPPNVIARLMGIDAIPPPPPPKPAAAAAAAATAGIIQAQPPQPSRSSGSSLKPPTTTISPRSSEPFRQAKCSLLSYSYRSRNGRRSSRSRQRRHPQEDLLQKIKHDFQAWQASNKSPANAALRAQPLDLDGRRIQMIAQDNLRKEKMARYGFASSNQHSHSVKNAVKEGGLASAGSCNTALAVAADEPKPEEKAITVLIASSPCAASEKFLVFEAGNVKDDGHGHISSDEKLLSPTTPIVLLKPTSDIHADGQRHLFGLPKVKRDGNMSRFLQEVKESLQKELRSNARSELNTITWGNGEPKHADAQYIKHPAVTKDHGKRFFRSESFRGFRSDRKRKEATPKQASPEHVRIVTRNILIAHRVKSVTSIAETVSPKKDDEESASSCSITGREMVRSLSGVSPSGNGFGDQSFRSECLMQDSDGIVSSARALFRSFSAPESGFSLSLGRLFGDGSGSVRSTRTTQEASNDLASEGVAAAMTSKNTSSALGFIRGTVSSLRHSFSLRSNLLFRRKRHWSKKTSLGLGELHPQMAAIGGPATSSPPETFNLFKVAQANLTELPPSPVSPLEVVGHSCRHFFSDLNCTLPEVSPKCPSELEAPVSELSYRTDITIETLCSHDKAYIREVLVAAGLYDDGSLDNKANNGRVDSMARPICDDIFEEVEDIYYYRGKYCDDDGIGMSSDNGGNATDHRMLFDLANEALRSLVQGAKGASSSLRQWVIDSTGVSRGRRLVDDVWQQVQTLRNPQMQEMQTIDSMVAYEIRKSVWDEVLYEGVYVVGRKIERAIFDELIEDLLIQVFI